MVDEELRELHDYVMRIARPEDLFGELVSEGIVEKEEELTRKFRGFLRMCLVENYRGNSEKWDMANAVHDRIISLHMLAVERVRHEVYGTFNDVQGSHEAYSVVTTKLHEYRIFNVAMVEGDICDIFEGEFTRDGGMIQKVLLKIVRDSGDNSMMLTEKRVLSGIDYIHLPNFVEQFKAEGDKLCNVLGRFDGYDLYQVRENPHYVHGVPEQFLAWVTSRALRALGFFHSKSILHGYLNPAHLLLNIPDHNMCIVDWCYALIDPRHTGASFMFYDETFSAPEILAKEPPVPSSDIYSLGKSLIYLAGGEPSSNRIPDNLHPRFQSFLKSFVLESRLQRPRDAWELLAEFENLRTQLWGETRFINFPW